MEQLLEQEADLESQVDTYKSQLSLVEQKLVTVSSEEADSNGSLSELCGDLKQLIALTEESLLELKKQRLLRMLHGYSVDAIPSPKCPPEVDQDSGASGSGFVDSSTPSSVDPVSQCEQESEDDLQGMKCQAPLKESWGTVSYHNAMVVCREHDEDTTQSSDGDFKVHLLFTHPRYAAMKACPYFLEGNCKFTADTCKFSHGHTALLSELQSYQEHDFELAHVGGKCLAKHVDDLWYPAIISSLGDTTEVHFSSLNVTAQLDLDSVMPQESSDDSETSSDSSSEDGDGVRVVQGSTPQLGTNQPLGDWEKHTKGFGSKLLARMGYVHGQGLGKARQGRVDPVEIEVLPAGKSLDACAEIREAKKVVKNEGKRKKRKKKKKQVVMDQQSGQEHTDMFDFLNTKILNKGGAQGTFQLEKDGSRKSVSAKDNGNLNIKLFKVQEDIKLVRKRRHSLQESLLRHKGKNKAMESHVNDKLANTEQEMARLVREEQSILKNISSKTEQKKLSVF